jgi:tail sheath protein
MAARRPLPGIRFESRTPPLQDPLPRMDIPAFVGFAASGPIDVPVPIEDPAEFSVIFGRDVSLPRRRGVAEEMWGHLAAAVRAFFANGGRRCWVVRVAGRSATLNRFPLPGLARVTPAGLLEPAEIVARSEGSWSDRLRVKTNLVSRPLAFRSFNPGAGGPTVDVVVGSRGEVAAGDLVRVTWSGVDASLHLFVQAVVASPPTSPLDAAEAVRVSGRSLWLKRDAVAPAPNPATLTGLVMAERLAFDLTVSDDIGAPVRLSRLGFAPDHPRYVGALPSDAVLFDEAVNTVDGRAFSFRPRVRATFGSNFLNAAIAPDAGWADLWRDASLPRFPLASEVDGAAYVPAGMGVLPSDPPSTAIPSTATSLDRDGLAVFDSSLFLDGELMDATLRELLDRADTIRYRSVPSRRLTGLHAVLSIDEATMVAVPDLVHAGWERVVDTPLASPLASSPLDHPEWWRWLDCRSPRPEPAPVAFSGFVDCVVTIPIAPPLLQVVNVSGGSYELRWDPVDGALVEVQESLRPDFSDAVTIALGPDGALTLYNRPPGDYYYRARRLTGSRTSDWSTGVAVRVPSLSGWIALETYDAATLVGVQRALVRVCAARADRVALLSLPGHYNAAMAIAHVTALTGPTIEPAALSYGALWHPWIVRRDTDSGALRTAPPEGMMAAVMAARAIARGAWVAPANEALRGVVALVPAILPETHQALQDAAINLLRQEPAGFVCLNADTLSLDEDLRPLNVRRLLILIRKAALRAGNRFTFEPHGERLRRAVKRGFEALLEEMFARGAFAGSRSREAFRVATDEPPNTPQDADAGRFLAEIRVAPSRPLSFLTMRLVQRGESAVAQEVR